MIEIISVCERRVSITIPAKHIKKEKRLRIKKDASKPLPGGFRGNNRWTESYIEKSSYKEKKTAEQALLLELRDNSFNKALKEEELFPALPPTFSDIQMNQDGSASYTATFEIYPPVTHVNWNNVTLDKFTVEMTEEDIIRSVDMLKGYYNETDENNLKEQAKNWSESLLNYIQQARLKTQVMDELIRQNPLQDLPKALLESHYQALKEKASNKESIDEKALQEQARRHVHFDALIYAYEKEHNIVLEQSRFEAKLLEVASTLKGDQKTMTQLMRNLPLLYQLRAQALEEQIIDHLLEKVNYNIKQTTFSEILGLPEEALTNASTSNTEIATTDTVTHPNTSTEETEL